MQTTRIIKFLVVVMVILAFITASVQAQEGGFTETFDDPALPSWEHSPNAIVVDGVLRIEPGGFATRVGAWVDFVLSIRARREGLGEMIITYRGSETGVNILIYNGERFLMQREDQGGLKELSEPAFLAIPETEWFQMELTVDGSEHNLMVNDESILSVSDSSSQHPGGISFETAGDTIAEFDDITLTVSGFGASEPPALQTTEPELESNDLSWIRTGGPPGGLGYDIRYNFDDPNTWYVTDNYAGVHISTDNGLTWQPNTTGIPPQSGPSGDAIPIFSLTVDPHNPQIIWVGTDGTGHIYKSTDGGYTWEEKDNGVTIQYDALTFRGFTIDPRSSDIVYAMAEVTSFEESEDPVWVPKGGVVYKTTDGGENWSVLWDGGMPSSLTRYMWIDPRDPDILFVSTGIFDRGAVGQVDADQMQTSIDPFGGLGILKSTDGGKTWQFLNKGNGLNSLYVGSLYMHPENPNILLAGTGHGAPEAAIAYLEEYGNSPFGVYRTDDGGKSWIQVIMPPKGRSFEAITSVEFCTSDPDVAYAGSSLSVYRSEDAGLTWTRVSGGVHGWGPPGVIAGSPIDMQCDPRDPNRIFANNYQGGNFLSEDGGQTWQNASKGYTGAQIIAIAVDPTNPARIYSGGRNGIWRSDDGGNTWYGIRNLAEDQLGSPEWGGITIDPIHPDRILAGGEFLYESLNGGASWKVYYPPPPFYSLASVIVFAPSDSNIVYAGAATHNTMIHGGVLGGQGMVVSRDGGKSWENITGSQFLDGPVLDISIHPQDPKIVFAATKSGVFKTNDGGLSWEALSILPDGRTTRTVGVDPNNPQHILVGVDEVGLFVSRDGGVTWQQNAAGLEPNASHRDILFDPTNSQVVYISDLFSGVYRSSDNGETWTKINSGLTNRAVTGLAISSDGLHLYAGTGGGGVYRLDLNGQPPGSSGSDVTSTQPVTEVAPFDATSSETPGLNTGVVIGIVLAVILVGVVVILITRRRSAKD